METEIMILNKPIRQFGGLYCLNDLHKASGCESRHKPAEWLRLGQTNELIKELQENSKVGIPTLKQNQEVIHVIHGGLNRGTYACRELVLAYATWISPKFFLLVLRTFDSVIQVQQAHISPEPVNPPVSIPTLEDLFGFPPPRTEHEARLLLAKFKAEQAKLYAEQANLDLKILRAESWLQFWGLLPRNK